MAKSIDLIWISVGDFDQAVKFYTDVVGLQLLEKNDQWKWAELQGETGARLGIGAACEGNGARPGMNGVITITVEDLDQSKKELMEKGAVAIGDECVVPGHVKMQLFKDADGNQFHIVQHLHATL